MTRYSPIQMALHWLMALLIISAFGLIWYFHSIEITSAALFKLKAAVGAWHKWVGISVLVLVAIRLLWRALRGAPQPLPNQPRWQLVVAAATHLLLYLMMFSLPLIGWMMSSAKGYPVVLFNWVQLPDLVSRDLALGHQLALLHKVVAYSLLALVGLHAAAALKHHFLDRDDTLRRMLPIRHTGAPQ